MSDQQMAALKQQAQYDDHASNTMAIVTTYYPRLGAKSLLGWDLARYISVCRLGYGAGYLSADKAWQRIMSIARQLQQIFSSWQDLGDNYVIGHMYWQTLRTELTSDKYNPVEQQLLTNPSSPWNTLPWNTDLGI